LAQDILAGQLVVRTEDKRRILVHADEIVSVIRQGEDPDKAARRTKGTGKKATGPKK
jgi:hypothetical protein